MKVRCRYSHWLPKKVGAEAITLYPYVLFGSDRQTSCAQYAVQHEFVHVRQVRKLGWLRFYASYVLQFLLGLLKTRSASQAYIGVSFEREAYTQERFIVLTPAELSESM